MATDSAFVAVLVICVAAYIFAALVNGDELLEDVFDATEPTGLVSGLQFVLDIAVGFAKFVFAILTLDIGLPDPLRFAAAGICGLIIVMKAIETLFAPFS